MAIGDKMGSLKYNAKQLMRLGIRGYRDHLLRHCIIPGSSCWSKLFIRQVDLKATETKLAKLLYEANDLKIVVSNWWGGGAESYIFHQSRSVFPTTMYALVSPTRISGLLSMELVQGGNTLFRGHFYGLKSLQLLGRFKISEIIVNQLTLWNWYVGEKGMTPNAICAISKEIIAAQKAIGCKLTYLLHDFYSVCPRITLVGMDNCYCKSEYSCLDCSRCLSTANIHCDLFDRDVQIMAWREAFSQLLSNATEVRAFSNDTADRISKIFRCVTPTVVPHRAQFRSRIATIKQFDKLRFCVFGNIGIDKGLNVIKELDRYLYSKNPVEDQILVWGNVATTKFYVTRCMGSYAPSEMARLIERNGVNVALFPSVWPETFSYVTQELMGTEVPIVGMNIGAQGERISKYKYGEVVSTLTPENIFLAAKRLLRRYSEETTIPCPVIGK